MDALAVTNGTRQRAGLGVDGRTDGVSDGLDFAHARFVSFLVSRSKHPENAQTASSLVVPLSTHVREGGGQGCNAIRRLISVAQSTS